MPRHISFYDESLKTQIEGSYKTDGKLIHAGSGTLGVKSAPLWPSCYVHRSGWTGFDRAKAVERVGAS